MWVVGRIFRSLGIAFLVLALLCQGSRPLFRPAPVAAQPSSVLTLTPASTSPGSVVTLNAPPGSLPSTVSAKVNFQDSSGAYPFVVIAYGTTGSDGSLNLAVRLPMEAAAGPGRVFVTAGGNSISSGVGIVPAITVSPAQGNQGSAVQVIGYGFSADGAATFQVNGQPAGLLSTDVVIVTLFGSFVALITIPNNTPRGPATITASDGIYSASAQIQVGDFPPALATPSSSNGGPGAGSTPVSGSETATPLASSTLPIATATATSQSSPTVAYFAEGFTGQVATTHTASFDEVLNLLNPTSSAVTTTITYYVQGTTPTTVTRQVPANSVLRERVNDDVGPNKAVAAMIASNAMLYVSRTISRAGIDGRRLDGSTAPPITAPARSWIFPEGYTGASFQEYLTVLNPSSQAATVTIVLAPQASSAAHARTLRLQVPALSRSTANIRALNRGGAASSVGMLIQSDQPIVPERVEYFGDGSGSGKFGSTVRPGIAAPASMLVVPYAQSGGIQARAIIGDQAYVTLLNPAPFGTPVTVAARFTSATGVAVGTAQTLRLAAGTRATIGVNAALGAQPAGPISIMLQATAPIAAEAAQYFGGSPNIGKHPGIAVPALTGVSHDAFFTDIGTVQQDGSAITRTIYIYNPGVVAIQVGVTFFGTDGSTVKSSYSVAAGSVTAINVATAIGGTLPASTLGAELAIAPGATGDFMAVAVGRTADGRSATEDLAQSAQ